MTIILRKSLRYFLALALLLGLGFAVIPQVQGHQLQKPLASHHDFAIRFEHVFDLGVPGGQAFLEDRLGFLWFGSEGGGLFRWDGYTLKAYPPRPDGLSNGNIYRIIQDATDPYVLWIGTGNGLNRFDLRTESFTAYYSDPDNPSTLSDNTIQDIVQDPTEPGVLWLATTNGLNRFDASTGTVQRYLHDPVNPMALGYPDLWRLLQDPEDPSVLWIGTYGGGLERFDKRSGTFMRYRHDPDDPCSLPDPDNLVDALIADRDEARYLWVGSPSVGLARFDKLTGEFTHYPQTADLVEVGLIYDDGRGYLWLGGYITNNGLTLFEKATGAVRTYRYDPGDPFSLSNDLVVNVAEDSAGRFWIVSYGGPVDKIDPYHQNFEVYRAQPELETALANNAVTALAQTADGALWVGTQGGLHRWDPVTGSFTRYHHLPDDPTSLPSDYILSITPAPDGDLWLGLWSGPLTRFDPRTGRVVATYPAETDGFADIVVDPDDSRMLWIGTLVAGLARFDTRSGQFTFYRQRSEVDQLNLGPSTGYLQRVLHDRRAPVLWMGGWYGGGLNRFDKMTGRFSHYLARPEDPNSLASNAIAALYQDESNQLWIGTQGGGLHRFDPLTDRFVRYDARLGIPSDVNVIVPDAHSHQLWLGTNEGLLLFDPRAGKVVRRYVKADGLQGDIFLPGSGLLARDGAVLLGGAGGLNRFYPDRLRVNTRPPTVVLTALTQGGQSLPQLAGRLPAFVPEIRLDWQHNFFEFEYVALNYTLPEKNQYAYKLEGVDADWRYVGTRRFGNYTTLPAGTYTLRIIAANNDGVWNEEGVRLKVTVVPPFWQTWWFRLSLFVLLVGGVGGGLLWRLRAAEAEQRKLEALVQQRTRELQDLNAQLQAQNLELENRNNELDAFAHTVAHDLKNPLAAIIGFAGLLEMQLAAKDVNQEQVIQNAHRILQAGRKMNYIIEELLLLSTIRKVTEIQLQPVDMGAVVQETLTRLQLEIEQAGAQIDLPSTWPVAFGQPAWVEEVWTNYLSNAIKYGGKPPHITLGWDVDPTQPNMLRFWVRDNGPGLTEEEQRRLFTMFTRLDKVRAKGHGLGLSIVRRIVEKLGGSVGVNSAPGQSSTFWFTLPRHQA